MSEMDSSPVESAVAASPMETQGLDVKNAGELLERAPGKIILPDRFTTLVAPTAVTMRKAFGVDVQQRLHDRDRDQLRGGRCVGT